jgi:hypothetical protein
VSLQLSAQNHDFFPSIPHSIRHLTVAFDLVEPDSFLAGKLAFDAACVYFPRLTNIQSFTLEHSGSYAPRMAKGWEWSMAPSNVRRLKVVWYHTMPPTDDLCRKIKDASWLPNLGRLEIRGPAQMVNNRVVWVNNRVVWGWEPVWGMETGWGSAGELPSSRHCAGRGRAMNGRVRSELSICRARLSDPLRLLGTLHRCSCGLARRP